MNSTELTTTEKHGLSANALKYIAIAAMLIDHIAWCFVDTYSFWGQIMHVIGRLTAPIMCYFIAEGYHYTRDVKKYLLRLGVFALISWFPYIFMEYGTLPIYFYGGHIAINPIQGVIYTLFLGLTALTVIHNESLNLPIKAVVLLIIFILSSIGDWLYLAIVWIMIFDKYRGNIKKQLLFFIISALIMNSFLIAIMPLREMLFQYGVLLAAIPLYFYNGKRGKSGSFNKWFFYVFYPLHMAILGFIKFCL